MLPQGLARACTDCFTTAARTITPKTESAAAPRFTQLKYVPSVTLAARSTLQCVSTLVL
jgi:hypothetical protein